MPQFRCVIVGSGTIALSCAELVHSAHHHVVAVIAPLHDSVSDWAEHHHIMRISPTEADVVLPQVAPFDYLFSIVSSLILSPQLLALPARAAINYHDAPLPRYAGAHAVTWSLIHGEVEHGVTWHLMTSQIDAGSIVQQALFSLAPTETALSLHVRCYEAARHTFAALLETLAQNTLTPRAQDLSARSFYGVWRRPAAAAMLRWSETAAALGALVRALHFGIYHNPLGLPKLLAGDHIFLVDSVEIVATTSSAPPGTIMALDDDQLLVATATDYLRITRFLAADGQHYPCGGVLQQLGLRSGDRLVEPGFEQTGRLTHHHEALCKHERFWVDRLAELAPIMPPYGLTRQSALHHVLTHISPELTAFLGAQDGDNESGEALLAACALLLGRLANQKLGDIGLRDKHSVAAAIGWPQLFAEIRPLSIMLEPTHTFAAALAQLRAARATNNACATYLSDIVARYPELRADPPRLPVLIELNQRLEELPPHVDLAVTISTNANTVEWRSRKGEPDALGRLAATLGTFVEAIVANPEQSLSRMPLLNTAEQQLITHWNRTERPYPHADFATLFEEQVARTPDAVALRFNMEQLSYRELNQRANQLAHELRARGIGSEHIVGVCVERSIAMVVALLGIIKAGGAYLPLDPNHPTERLDFMLRDAGAALVLAHSRLAQHIPATRPVVLRLDEEWPSIATHPEHNLTHKTSAEHLAYVIYTSGSTGQPKGVMVTHRGIGNLAQAQIETFGISAQSRVLQFASFGFDASVSEIVTTLLAGATLCLATQEQLFPGPDLEKLLQTHAITVATLPPSVLALLEPSLVPALTTVVSAGEPCPPEVVARWAPGRTFINAYGPTEATVCATMAVCEPNGQWPTLGRPIDNCSIQILDHELEPLPVGIPGELCIGGVGLARGYIGVPESNTNRFVFDPARPGERLYRSGDMARWLPNGELEYLGRLDSQVKLRGFRIELGEIESVLLQHWAVRQAVACVREDIPGDRRLVAYVVTVAEPPADITAVVRTHLHAHVPEYMVPGTIMLLERMPLTRNGKVDTRNLPAPITVVRTNIGKPPQTPFEREVAAIWREVLGLEIVSVQDNFFELGGHSLLATQVVSRLRETLHVEVPLSVLMSISPTVIATARALEERQILQADPSDLADVLAEIEQLSEAEVNALLQEVE